MDITKFYNELIKSRKGVEKNRIYLTDDEYYMVKHIIEF